MATLGNPQGISFRLFKFLMQSYIVFAYDLYICSYILKTISRLLIKLNSLGTLGTTFDLIQKIIK